MTDAPITKLIQTRQSCPLCVSTARTEIDIIIYERHFRALDVAQDNTIDSDGNAVGGDDSFTETEKLIRELLDKSPNQKTPDWSLADLVLHGTQHSLITEVAGLRLRTEGNLLHANQTAYQTPDLKDALGYVIARGLQDIADNKLKITPPMFLNSVALMWRMSGNSGADDIVLAILDKVQRGDLDAASPLGKARAEREQSLKNSQLPQREMDAELDASKGRLE